MPTLEKTLPVSAIQNGTVIDHIPAGKALKIVKLLNLSTERLQTTLGLNLPSGILGLKDLIKIEGFVLSSESASKTAILAPLATVNIINNYEVQEKFQVSLPKKIQSVISCPNTLCISSQEKVDSIILVKERWKGNIQLQCHYCRKQFSHQDI
ncbi:Aspartate carbamoyltransferase regulatory chain [Waddlia chondrophila 2032/99]|uniref:Aspartate carbamoyltransferase regulatory chain n=2 Tax=Waddlia chondrophila TaxID=71667 RepID=D6YUA3_WADCW|nr:aspartate carbamoyltransferase regulatory subunit [Waddlia chondrophila]ADI37714.1 Aspartate carbamoyltransferase, regulatory subunit [Waddlia chondrophila WSU 86-1044]CCB90942.1 Aspartate carbamoyltransferase regulatory chain [Waddlia chondrophila 2032/99]